MFSGNKSFLGGTVAGTSKIGVLYIANQIGNYARESIDCNLNLCVVVAKSFTTVPVTLT